LAALEGAGKPVWQAYLARFRHHINGVFPADIKRVPGLPPGLPQKVRQSVVWPIFLLK
jgi:hypothetical protein